MNLCFKRMLFGLLVLCLSAPAGQSRPGEETAPLEYIDFIHCSHTDYGYTDHPVIVEELQRRFLDIALDAALATRDLPRGERFVWTAEALDIVWQWWRSASPERRAKLEQAIRDGQIEITALPFNFHPFLDGRLWQSALNWIPESLWQSFHPRVAVQHDVNGFPRAAAMALLDRGVDLIWTGINTYWGGAPFLQPSGFWWEMPDGRRLLVWQSLPYWFGYNLLTEQDWRMAQRQAADTQFRTPRIGDILAADEASVRKAHRICLSKIRELKNQGYPHDFLAVSITNQWRIDNDGPFPPFTAFVAKWNSLGLRPRLRLTTMSQAMRRIAERAGDRLAVQRGEWPDWWAFGGAASPRELSAARRAGFFLRAALSPAWGGNPSDVLNRVQDIDRTLCRYFEHTFGTNQTTRYPFGFFTLGHLAEKSIYAYRPYEQARWLLAQRMRSRFTDEEAGLYIVNPGDGDYSGWIELDPVAFRGVEFHSVQDEKSGESHPLYVEEKSARFWVEDLEPHSTARFLLSTDSPADPTSAGRPEVSVDSSGWPTEIRWPGMSHPLFSGEIGNFLSIESRVGRDLEPEIWDMEDAAARERKVGESTALISMRAEEGARVSENPFTLLFRQVFSHPRLGKGIRELEVWKKQPRIRLVVRINRLSSSNPEVFYVRFPLSTGESFPLTSNGGAVFRPYLDQIPGTCTDFFTIDGWIGYRMGKGSLLWSSPDVALVGFSSPRLAARRISPPEKMDVILAMIYNNLWEVNFLSDCPGEMEFQFDLAWLATSPPVEAAGQTALSGYTPPIVMLNSATREDPHTSRYLHRIGK